MHFEYIIIIIIILWRVRRTKSTVTNVRSAPVKAAQHGALLCTWLGLGDFVWMGEMDTEVAALLLIPLL